MIEHYIPKCLIRNFFQNDTIFVKRGEKRYQQKIKGLNNIFGEHNFYSKLNYGKDIENYLSGCENIFKNMLDNIIASTNLNNIRRDDLYLFMTQLRIRVPNVIERIPYHYIESEHEIKNIYLGMLGGSTHFNSLFDDSNFYLLRAHDDFILSQNPVAILPMRKPEDLSYVVPISTKFAILSAPKKLNAQSFLQGRQKEKYGCVYINALYTKYLNALQAQNDYYIRSYNITNDFVDEMKAIQKKFTNIEKITS